VAAWAVLCSMVHEFRTSSARTYLPAAASYASDFVALVQAAKRGGGGEAARAAMNLNSLVLSAKGTAAPSPAVPRCNCEFDHAQRAAVASIDLRAAPCCRLQR